MYKLMIVIFVIMSGCNPPTFPDCFEGDVKGIASPVNEVSVNGKIITGFASPVNQVCLNGEWK